MGLMVGDAEESNIMSMPLADALAQVDLEAGRVYRCEVKGRKVEVRVLEEVSPSMLPTPLIETDIMLDPWVEFPLPSGTFEILATPGPLPLDVPVIPAEEGPA
jgi:hypothetical protein